MSASQGGIKSVGLASVLAVVFLLPGCQDDTENHVLWFQRGVYSGAPDTPISEEIRATLDERLAYQGL